MFGRTTGAAAGWLWATCIPSAVVPLLVWDTSLSALVLAVGILSNFDAGTWRQRFSVGRYRLLVGVRLSRESSFDHASAFHSFFTMVAPKAKR